MKNNFVKIEKAKKQSKIVLLPTKNDCTKIVNQFIDDKITNEKMWELIEKQVNKSLK
tara:strand:- start:88 stop:258 length:171 start_codon:yes stop_codon:yes gene_type:complete